MRKQTTLQTVYPSESIYAMTFTFIYHEDNNEKEKHETAERSSPPVSDTSY